MNRAAMLKDAWGAGKSAGVAQMKNGARERRFLSDEKRSGALAAGQTKAGKTKAEKGDGAGNRDGLRRPSQARALTGNRNNVSSIGVARSMHGSSKARAEVLTVKRLGDTRPIEAGRVS